jgi:hypothetical protein
VPDTGSDGPSALSATLSPSRTDAAHYDEIRGHTEYSRIPAPLHLFHLKNAFDLFWRKNETEEVQKQQEDRDSIPNKLSFRQVTEDQISIARSQLSMPSQNEDQGSITTKEAVLMKLQSQDQGSIPSKRSFPQVPDDQTSMISPQLSISSQNSDRGLIALILELRVSHGFMST